MDCSVEPGIGPEFSAAVRACGAAPQLRVFGAGRFEEGRRYFLVEVCEPDPGLPGAAEAHARPAAPGTSRSAAGAWARRTSRGWLRSAGLLAAGALLAGLPLAMGWWASHRPLAPAVPGLPSPSAPPSALRVAPPTAPDAPTVSAALPSAPVSEAARPQVVPAPDGAPPPPVAPRSAPPRAGRSRSINDLEPW